jgi:hypothetical protein
MLVRAKDLWGFGIGAANGDIGRIHDLQVDDRRWAVRDIVVDVGHWLTGRLVLLDPSVVVKADRDHRTLHAALTVEQIAEAPRVETHPSVARQRSVESYHYLGLPLLFGGFEEWTPALAVETPVPDPMRIRRLDPHLRSLRELSHYRIEAIEGEAGDVEDWLVDVHEWVTPYAVVKPAGHRRARRVLVPVRWLGPISWSGRIIHTDLHLDTVVHAPDWDPSAPLDTDYELRLRGWYGHPARRADAAWWH